MFFNRTIEKKFVYIRDEQGILLTICYILVKWVMKKYKKLCNSKTQSSHQNSWAKLLDRIAIYLYTGS